jgi:hypothetical protein
MMTGRETETCTSQTRGWLAELVLYLLRKPCARIFCSYGCGSKNLFSRFSRVYPLKRVML